ncbi:3-beta hydroxysteroid dehydrogenase [Prolixibacter bellariivorans]|uniref:3-beta hydroxysteroid dehydrogenase n=1 Tax=Prolixibacter bellariivorans TaxID=314319 RepID=A0A5M4B406_9BACT|nr:SDR family oxidoreductase [Prolixibacter bellariivorans]GET34543.1 3-beta hydroxysteroid dehydrogenase [Prolixibacter bellariivorans]
MDTKQTTETVLLAGATGYLGHYIAEELIRQNIPAKIIARRPEKVEYLGGENREIIHAEVTRPETLIGVCEGVTTVISSIGITRQKDGLTYMDVDYQANLNLLNEAKKAGVRKFIYVSAINGDKYRQLKIFQAKEAFVDALKASGLDYTVMRPNGFFSDMRDFLDMAKGGRVYLFGDGHYQMNPIHGEDLAKVCVNAISSEEKEIAVGGPDNLSQNELATLALKAWNKPIKITHLPDWIRRMTIGLVRTFTSSKTYGPIEFFLTLMADDQLAPNYGEHHLEDFFKKEAERMRREK